jgi:hypothetical protein
MLGQAEYFRAAANIGVGTRKVRGILARRWGKAGSVNGIGVARQQTEFREHDIAQ